MDSENREYSILIIDDEKMNFMILNDILYPEYTVYTASNGAEGIKMAREYLPDVILLDILMPDINGYEVFSSLRETEETCDIPVIFVSGLKDEDDVVKGLNLGVADYITKPFKPEFVKLRVENQIKISRKMEAEVLSRTRHYIKELETKSEQLELALDRAHAAGRSRRDFLAAMSHEIRTPLNAIIGITQMEMQKQNIPDEFASAFEKIYSSGIGLLGIINDILDLSKIESGKMELHEAKYDLPGLINDTTQLNIIQLSSKPIEFIVNVDEDLPSKLVGDELRLKQVLNNLLSNAIKYTSRGYVKLTVTHIQESNNSVELVFIVEDTGRGISDDDLKRMFTTYTRFDADHSGEQGTGLGLSISKSLVVLMGGNIKVESEYGKGSTFIATVKQKAVRCKKIGPKRAEKLRTFTFMKKNQLNKRKIQHDLLPYGKVLVVDDVESNLYVAHGLLSAYKLTVDTADSGIQAIEMIKKGKSYDIIFMDHMMPDLDGIETTQALRKMGYKNPIVALTANALVGNDKMFMQRGFDGFISKPIDIKHLDNILNRFIRVELEKNIQENLAKELSIKKDLSSGKNIDLVKSFLRDAVKAVDSLHKIERELYLVSSGDIDLKAFITVTHAMKSALANIGETEKSAFALNLETAGRNGDRIFILDNIDPFINMIETLIAELRTINEPSKHEDHDVTEDLDYLTKHLSAFIAACEQYDITAAFAAIDAIKENSWNKDTMNALNELHDILFLDSDFEAAIERAKIFSMTK